MLGEAYQHGRHHVAARDLVFLNQLQKLYHVKSRHGHDGSAPHQGHIHDHHHAVDVVERQHADYAVGAGDQIKIRDAFRLHNVGHDIEVGEHDTFGQAG